MTKRTLLAVAIAIACGTGAAHAQAPVADFFSTTSLKDGQPLAAGTIIEAWDSEGIRCGYAEASPSGGFLIHVYGNDPMTPSIDEGAREGEMLEWRVSGVEVHPEDAQWIARGTEGAGRIKDIVARMNSITQVAETPARGYLPPMLDIRKSSEAR